jgi:hypothetical protein
VPYIRIVRDTVIVPVPKMKIFSSADRAMAGKSRHAHPGRNKQEGKE